MLQVEQVLQERYQLKQKLGQNAGRQTWLAEDLAKQPTESVIVKLLAFGDQVQWDNLKLFEREANVLKQLNHPQIPKYRDYFSIDDRILWFGLVQDYIPGSSLKELLAQGRRFSKTEVQKIAINVLQILVYLHELSPIVLHRDIKPSNLILGQDETIYLVDFGAVQDRVATEGATFTVVGTYGYAPMEQFGGRAVPASDLYALGATLIHLLTGTAPADLPQRNMRIQFSDKVSLSPHFVNWIETLIQPDVEQRFRSARQSIDALRTGNNPNSSALTSKPYGSRIQLKKSYSQLKIKIPGRRIQFPDDIYMIVCLLIWHGFTLGLGRVFFPVTLIFLIAGLIPLVAVLFPILGSIYISFHRTSFLIKWKLLGLPYRKWQGKTSAIDGVGKGYEFPDANGSSSSGIVIRAGVQSYKFGVCVPPIIRIERDWLVQEIRDWLGFKRHTKVVKTQDSCQESSSKAFAVYYNEKKNIEHWRSHIIVNPVDAHAFRTLGVMLYQQNYKGYRDEAIANLKIAYGLFQKKGEKQEAMLTLKLWEMVFRRVNPKMLMTVYPAIDEGSGE
ncbi:MAG: serine/threonine-protein kinase [Coleofasciculaceae cyanobacterium]